MKLEIKTLAKQINSKNSLLNKIFILIYFIQVTILSPFGLVIGAAE